MTIDMAVVGNVCGALLAAAMAGCMFGCMHKARKAIEGGPAFMPIAWYWLVRAAIWMCIWGVLMFVAVLRH